MQSEEQLKAWDALPSELRQQHLVTMVDAYRFWLPFAELWETHGLPVDVIGIKLEEVEMLNYSAIGEAELRRFFKTLIEIRNETRKRKDDGR